MFAFSSIAPWWILLLVTYVLKSSRVCIGVRDPGPTGLRAVLIFSAFQPKLENTLAFCLCAAWKKGVWAGELSWAPCARLPDTFLISSFF